MGQLSREIANQIADTLGTSVLGCTSLMRGYRVADVVLGQPLK